jgi:hypothetical protein
MFSTRGLPRRNQIHNRLRHLHNQLHHLHNQLHLLRRLNTHNRSRNLNTRSQSRNLNTRNRSHNLNIRTQLHYKHATLASRRDVAAYVGAATSASSDTTDAPTAARRPEVAVTVISSEVALAGDAMRTQACYEMYLPFGADICC